MTREGRTVYSSIHKQKENRIGRKEILRAERKWNNQFPPLSCHPPFASPNEIEMIEAILETRRNKKRRITYAGYK